MWSMLSAMRTSPLIDEMIDDGELVEVTIEGSSRRYLARREFLATRRVRYDDRVRILGPLDPLLWDRDLVRHVFDFDYVWEVYKPAHQRQLGLVRLSAAASRPAHRPHRRAHRRRRAHRAQAVARRAGAEVARARGAGAPRRGVRLPAR